MAAIARGPLTTRSGFVRLFKLMDFLVIYSTVVSTFSQYSSLDFQPLLRIHSIFVIFIDFLASKQCCSFEQRFVTV